MLVSSLIIAATHTAQFWTRPSFWEGAAAASVVGGAIAQWGVPPVRKRWRERRNRNLFLDGREAIPNVANAILSASERMNEMDKDIKGHTHTLTEQSETLKEHGDILKQIVGLLEGIATTTKTTNERVAENGGDTSSLADVMQRVARKMKVYDLSATARTDPATGEETVTELHASALNPEVPS